MAVSRAKNIEFVVADHIPEIFCDGMLGVTVKDGVLRTNLVSERAPAGGSGEKVKHVAVARLVMGLPAFLQVCRNFQEWANQMESEGWIDAKDNPFSKGAPTTRH